MSYPDLIEEGGKFYITETQKNVGRVHEVPGVLVDGLFTQFETRTIARDGLALELSGKGPDAPGDGGRPLPTTAPMPKLPEFHVRDAGRPDYGGADTRAGFTLDLWLEAGSTAPGQVLLDTRDGNGRGVALVTAAGNTLKLSLNDGRTESSWTCDAGSLHADRLQHVAVVIDGGPKIITFVVDGVLQDGGEARQFGWGRFSPTLRAPNGAAEAKLGPALRSLRIYQRALRTSEIVGNFRAGA